MCHVTRFRVLRTVNELFDSSLRTSSVCYGGVYRPYSSNSENTKSSKATYLFSGTAFGLATGLSISYGLYKYFQINRCDKCTASVNFTRLCPKMPVVDADQIINANLGSGDNSQTTSPRKTYNFLADIAEKIAPSVVYVEIKARHPVTNQFIAISNGSGFIIKSDGLILTNAHVVANKSTVIVKLLDGREFQGYVEDQDTETDLATVRIKAKDLPVLPLGQSSNLRPGEFVLAMGNPLTLHHTITAGVISSVHRPSKELGLHHETDYIQTDAAINIGNSGGPLVNLDGEAIGINTMKVTEGISFAIPSDRAITFLKRVEENRSKGIFGRKSTTTSKPKKKYIGITMLSLTPSLIEELQSHSPDFPQVEHGVLIWKVLMHSPAYEGGIRPGDVITDINGIEIDSAEDIYKIIKGEEILNIKVHRACKVLKLKVVPQDPTE